MSTTGLYSGIYVQLREFGELVDEVLMELKGGGSLYNQNVDALASRFKEIGVQDAANLQAQMLRVVLQERMGKSPGYWANLAHRLRNKRADDKLVADLERIAAIVEHERAGAFAEMRG